ncbi:MAG: NAD(P)H-binding protein [Actinomycetota bacterium]|nr:NAD(P)H-binding protein [Actinomycetota bacterium]
MHLTVFGSTGPTGRELVRQATAEGHSVLAVARRPEALEVSHPLLEIVRGDVMDPDSIAATGTGADAVLSAIGTRNMKQPTNLYSQGTAAILLAMAASCVARFVGVTAAPVAPMAASSLLDRYVGRPILWHLFRGGYADMAAMEEVLTRSECDWTIFRPPWLRNGGKHSAHSLAVMGGAIC